MDDAARAKVSAMLMELLGVDTLEAERGHPKTALLEPLRQLKAQDPPALYELAMMCLQMLYPVHFPWFVKQLSR